MRSLIDEGLFTLRSSTMLEHRMFLVVLFCFFCIKIT